MNTKIETAETKLELEIDGEQVEVRPGATVLEAARELGVEIPVLCHDDRVDPAGCCRMCLVEIEGQRRLQPACTFKASPGMEVKTKTERVARHRRGLLSLYKADHRLDERGRPVSRGVHDKLADHIDTYGTGPELPPVNAPRASRSDENPYIQFDPDACVVCGLCVRYCDEVEAVSAITLFGRGASTTIGTADQRSLLDTSCELCGGCIAVCPTGAMTEKPSLDQPSEQIVRTTCNFCGVGCQLDLHVATVAAPKGPSQTVSQDLGAERSEVVGPQARVSETMKRVVRVTSPEPGTTVNDGNLCVKGRFSYEFIHHEERLTEPLIRGEDGELHPASWADAIARVAEGLHGVKQRYGADALGFVSSSRCTGEENYLMQKLSRAAFGTNNCHQCAAT
ncbi:putative formate dehydrogenase [Enhygromyxa salina]|nr:putative formate dehydrogenase [Enhygromyxa salina]